MSRSQELDARAAELLAHFHDFVVSGLSSSFCLDTCSGVFKVKRCLESWALGVWREILPVLLSRRIDLHSRKLMHTRNVSTKYFLALSESDFVTRDLVELRYHFAVST